jgi:hypothetical protein
LQLTAIVAKIAKVKITFFIFVFFLIC